MLDVLVSVLKESLWIMKKESIGKKKKFILLKMLAFAFIVYMSVILVNQQMQINQKRREIEECSKQVAIQEIKIQDMKRVIESDEKENQGYIDRIAREDLGFAKRNERVFINIIGN